MRLINGNCLDILKDMENNSVTSIITDPPYGLKFMGKKWDYDVPSVEVWKECLRVLKPGGTLLCFAGTRTQHRMAVNIEDAGFVLKDTVMWLYGSGFPKALDIGKVIDKKLGNEREVKPNPLAKKQTASKGTSCYGDYEATKYITKGTSEWEGYKSHSLKPAYEPILLAMKPNDGSYADNALKHGVAGLNVDGSRVELNGDKKITGGCKTREDNASHLSFRSGQINKEDNTKGRFPANIIHDNSEQVVSCFPKTSTHSMGNKSTAKSTGMFGVGIVSDNMWRKNDSGSASRFFKSCPILDEDIETQRIFYTAKASKKERNEGLEGFEERERSNANKMMGKAGSFKTGSGNDRKIKFLNNHPTVKPIKLLEYLVGLVKMPEDTLILDPFMGSGTTGIACANNDVDFIGIELEPEYFEIAKARIEHAKNKVKQLSIV